MKDHIRDRIMRALEGLPDERGYQILDYAEFLQSKFAERTSADNIFAKISDKVEDTLRAGKVSASAISGTVSFIDGASKVAKGLAGAAQSVVDEVTRTAKDTLGSSDQPKPVEPPQPPSTPPTDAK